MHLHAAEAIDPSTSQTASPTSGSGVTQKLRTPSPKPGSSQERPQAVVLLSIAQQMLLDQGKMLDTARLAAFTKKLSCVALHLESGAALGNLSLVNRLLRFARSAVFTMQYSVFVVDGCLIPPCPYLHAYGVTTNVVTGVCCMKCAQLRSNVSGGLTTTHMSTI